MKKMNVRALIANLLITLVMAGMLCPALAAHGVALHFANVAAIVFAALCVVLPIALTEIKVKFTHRTTGKVVTKTADKLVIMKWLIARWTRPMTAGINREIWENHILENLFPSDSFLEGLLDESEYVNNLTVHSPQAGGNNTVLVDPAFPLNGGNGLAVTQRSDSTVDWNIHVFFYPPIVITNAEEVQLSYNKRESVLYEMEMELRRVIAENLIVYCAPTGTSNLPANLGGGVNNNILRTSGVTNNDVTNIQSSPAYTTGATGNRLNFTLFDITNVKTFMDNQNIPDEDRYLLLSPNAERQLINDMIASKYRGSLSDVFDLKTGTVSALMGFKIYKRSQVMQYTNAATPVVKAWGSAGAATDNDCILFWQKAGLAKAFGDIHIYEQLNSPKDGGDIYSVLIRMGATKKRYSELGVVAMVQSPSA
jgi:hypothetical protein